MLTLDFSALLALSRGRWRATADRVFDTHNVAKLLLEKKISAVPVIDKQDKLVGIVSEGDLMHRAEASTERRRSWWLQGLIGDDTLAADYVKLGRAR